MNAKGSSCFMRWNWRRIRMKNRRSTERGIGNTGLDGESEQQGKGQIEDGEQYHAHEAPPPAVHVTTIGCSVLAPQPAQLQANCTVIWLENCTSSRQPATLARPCPRQRVYFFYRQIRSRASRDLMSRYSIAVRFRSSTPRER
jgi:hypothetical protein